MMKPDTPTAPARLEPSEEVTAGARTEALEPLSRWTLRVGIALLVCVTVGLALGVRYNSTHSMPKGFYTEAAVSAEEAAAGLRVQRGELVMFCLPPDVAAFGTERGYLIKGRCPGGVAPLGKAVVAVEGDTVLVTDLGVNVNGEPVPFTEPLRVDSKGRTLHPKMGERVIGVGEAFVVSNYHGRSFDSRYYGPIKTAAIRGRIREVLTWGNDWEEDPRKFFAHANT